MQASLKTFFWQKSVITDYFIIPSLLLYCTILYYTKSISCFLFNAEICWVFSLHKTKLMKIWITKVKWIRVIQVLYYWSTNLNPDDIDLVSYIEQPRVMTTFESQVKVEYVTFLVFSGTYLCGKVVFPWEMSSSSITCYCNQP